MSTDDVAHALGERIKELTALHAAAALIEDIDQPVTDVLKRIASALPPAFQFPDITEARVQHGELIETTARFVETPWMLTTRCASSDGVAARIDVVYLDERPASVEGPFLVEERRLLDSIGRMLESALNRRLAQAETRVAHRRLEATLQSMAEERDRSRMLLEISNAIASRRDVSDLLATISHLLTRMISHHFASVTLWDEEADTLRRHALVSDGRAGLVLDGALLGTDYLTPARVAFDRGETMVFRSREIQEMGEHAQRVMAAEGMRSACCIPLKSVRGIMGTLNFASTLESAFDQHEIDLLQQIANQFAIALDNALAYREISALKDRLNEEKLYLEDEVSAHQEFRDIVGKSHALTDVLQQIRTVAPTDATVLLLGETGTGKELLARAVHEASRRRTETFVRVNGAAMPANLVESELFGHERGAFTGATATKVGRFELAHRGTLFLDEIGEVPLDVQPKLLRALQEQEFERLGSTRTIHVDVRVIAATNRELDRMVAAGSFREDLYYRLNVFPIAVPPLRERPDDMAPLVTHFTQKFAREMGRTITSIPSETLRALQGWTWPGNIRELQNVIERAVILSHGGALRIPAGVFKGVGRRAPDARGSRPAASDAAAPLLDAEREMILKALRDADGIIGGPSGAAVRLGLKRTTLHSKMQKLGIVRQSY